MLRMSFKDIIKATKKGFGEGFKEGGELSPTEIVLGAVGFVGSGYAVLKYGQSALCFARKKLGYRDAVSSQKDENTASLRL